MKEIVIPETIIRDIARAEEDFCRRVRKCDPMEAARNLTLSHGANLERLRDLLGAKGLSSARILEIGSGNGFLLCHARKQGVDMVGVEPGEGFGFEGRHAAASQLLRRNGIDPAGVLFDAPAEALPFADDSFDLVFSIAVLEHVGSIDRVMSESLRVLRPGGMLWANVPNYHSWHENHYDLFWLPFFGKRAAKLYVKLRGREPSYVDTLNFTTPSDFRPYLAGARSGGTLYLRGRGLTAYLFEAWHLVRRREDPAPPAGRPLKKLLAAMATGRAGFLVRWPLGLLARLLGAAGMAPVFDVILYKNADG